VNDCEGCERRVKPDVSTGPGVSCTPFRVGVAPVVIVHERKGSSYVEVCRVGKGEARQVDQPFPVRIEPAALVGGRRRTVERSGNTPDRPGTG
jgi:hypothetical protein